MELNWFIVDETIKRSLNEDLGRGDITTDSIVPVGTQAFGHFIAKEAGVVAGITVAARTFQLLSPDIQMRLRYKDGEKVVAGELIAEIEGPARPILWGERVALNFLQRMSGIATLTAEMVSKVQKYGVEIIDTRKTTPGLRLLEKYAVRQGGGVNHRMGLDDAVLIKDNHIAVAGGIIPAIKVVRANASHMVKIEVEVENEKEVLEALEAGADVIMLDNMDPEEMAKMVKLIDKKAVVEASGNVNLNTVEAIAKTGVDVISVGALTHSVTSLDISLDLFHR
ncbi:MAG TPA: carboxylating nicotinate-nucleotide diphosphorylase [Firmicutes bacterium]|jgi:nicotinate-nucleotide pyrophosphorylase (carboxylating)|nr:carboxylating nicotinate-nucleotide diphosphorylase [Bacillota bacterium]